ncbi:MAG: SsrA-binding protein SmpB [Myxococcales bacterium]
MAKTRSGVKVVAENRKARFNYSIEEKYEAGLELVGSEVKSLREGTLNLSDSYVAPERGQLFLINCHIGPYKAASALGHVPLRKRRLLMKRHEIDKITAKVTERGYTLVPLSVYFKDGWAKVEIGLGKGKNTVDRREDIKQRETRREVDRAMRRR